MHIKFMASDHSLYVDGNGVIPSGCVNVPTFSVALSSDWDGYSVTAQFIGCGNTLHVAGIKNNCVYAIPWECLSEPGAVTVSLKGICEDKVRTTLPVTLSVRASLVTDGTEPQTATPSAYEQYVRKVEEFISAAYNDFESSDNKTYTFFGDYGNESYPTANAVYNFISDIMMYNLEDGMEEDEIWGIATPSSVVKYVRSKTVKPTWHCTTVTVSDDTTFRIELNDTPCYGVKVMCHTVRGATDSDIVLELFSSGEQSAFYRLDGSKYVSSVNDETYGVLTGELINGMWDGNWSSAVSFAANMWTTSYNPRFQYRTVSEQSHPTADSVVVRSPSSKVLIPNGSVFEIWRLY